MEKKNYHINKSKSIFLIPIDDFFVEKKIENVYSLSNGFFFDSNNETNLSNNSFSSSEENGEINSFFSQNKTLFMNNVFMNDWKTKIAYFKRYKFGLYNKKVYKKV
jgi:hypothetical protein